MMLRSSSTPLLGSLISSVSDSPSNHHHTELHTTPKHAPSPVQNCSKFSCSSGGSQNYSRSLRGSSSPSVAEIKTQSGLRRVQSEGNMEMVMESYNLDEFSLSKKFARKSNFSSLEPIISFTHHKLGTSFEDYEDSEEEESEDEIEVAQFKGYSNSATAKTAHQNMVLEQMTKTLNDRNSWGLESEGMLYMASGPGISGINLADNGENGGGNGGGSSRPVAFDRGGGGGDNKGLGMEEHYKKMLAENPGNPLFLRNYAHFLYQTKGDLPGAEEYYSRAILADPEDGEVLSQYATLVWDLHQDKERAASYFERAVRVSSEDSHIHAAYASFLWDAEDDEDEEENTTNNSHFGQPFIHHGIMASATV